MFCFKLVFKDSSAGASIIFILEDKKAEVKAEERLNVCLEVDEVSDLRLEDKDLLRKAEGYTKRKKDAADLGG